MYDVAIIGAGVVGASIARELAKYKLKIIILEKAGDVALGTTKANSAIIHAGYDAPYGTLKGELNAKGNAMFDQVCAELSVSFKRIGSMVLAFDDEQCDTLKALKENGERLGIPELSIIERDEILALEPKVNPEVKRALLAKTAGITEPWELAIAYAENAVDNGAELRLNYEVIAIEQVEHGFVIKSHDAKVITKKIINAAGVYADAIYNMVAKSDFIITPRRGQYYVLDHEAADFVGHVLFPCPSKAGKGILIVPTVDGNVLIGPNSEDLTIDNKESTETTIMGLDEVKQKARLLSPNIPYALNIRTFSGLRAEPSTHDFIIKASDKVDGFINVAGIKSPGLSSVPAIAEMVVDIFKAMTKTLQDNPNFNPNRRARIRFNQLSFDEKNAQIIHDPRYGNVVCRCEVVTEAEIIDAIHRPVGAKTLNGVKRRVRPGAGRCQGGFCGPKVLQILKRELSLEPTEVLLEDAGSNIIIGKTKSGVHYE